MMKDLGNSCDHHATMVPMNRHSRSTRAEVGNAVGTCSGQHRGVPSWFRGRCAEAQAGGTNSYTGAGYHLSMHLANEAPYGLDEEQWAAQMEHVGRMLVANSADEVWCWLRERLPRFVALVPSRRKDQFLRGFWQAYEDGCFAEQ